MAKGKMKFPFRQNMEKLDLIKLLSSLLTTYVLNNFSKYWDKLKNVNNFHLAIRHTVFFKKNLALGGKLVLKLGCAL